METKLNAAFRKKVQNNIRSALTCLNDSMHELLVVFTTDIQAMYVATVNLKFLDTDVAEFI